MARNATKRTTPPRERRIIERPRLLRLIEDTPAATILLVAPAGYGKTTLAKQWAAMVSGSWFAARPGASDVVVLARGLAEALADHAPELPRRIDEAIALADDPNIVAEQLGAELARGVRESGLAWLVIDDYHVIIQNAAADTLVSKVEESSGARVLVTSRTRPAWATSRRRVYGEILEIGQRELALDADETDRVLGEPMSGSLVVENARGWPAVIGLAAVATLAEVPPPSAVAGDLYEFFADEILSNAPPETQEQLFELALLPRLDKASLTRVLGSADAVARVVETGLAYEDSDSVEIHPLAADFIKSKVRSLPDCDDRVANAIEFALGREEWDHVFGLIEEFDRSADLAQLITASFSPLAETGRTTTLERFAMASTARYVPQPLLDIVNATIAYRDGAIGRARTLAIAAANRLDDAHPLRSGAYAIAGNAAQLEYRLEDAYALHERALATATTPRESNDARWGRCLAALYLEDERLRPAVQEMEEVTNARPEDRLRILTARQHLARLVDGLYDSSVDRELGEQLLRETTDPRVRTAWGNTLGYSLTLQARYEEAKAVLTTSLKDIDSFALAFGRPHIHWTLAADELGLRRFSHANTLLSKIERNVEETPDAHLALNARALRARLLLAQRQPLDAAELTEQAVDPELPSRAMYGEYMATHALVLAVAGRADASRQAAETALAATRAVETRVLAAAAMAISSLGTEAEDDAVHGLFATATALMTWDPVVCAVRAEPDLLRALASDSTHRPQLTQLLRKSRDTDLARREGLTGRAPYGRGGTLSRREHEVLDLLQQGLRNREIADVLFISQATVKVHIHHILEKLGARTRAEAVARYADLADDSVSISRTERVDPASADSNANSSDAASR